MATMQRLGTFLRETKIDTYVTCPMCSWEIALACTSRPPGEFSVECPNCSQRNIYQSLQAHDSMPSAPRTKPHGRAEFSTRAVDPVQPKSWLSAWVDSL